MGIHASLQPATRTAIEAQIEQLIDLLDQMDGDVDLEPSGDELDGSMGEDDFCRNVVYAAGPGCPIADPDYGGEELGELDNFYEPEFSDPAAYRDQILRIHALRCYPIRTQRREGRAVRSCILRHQLIDDPTVPTKRQIMRRKRGVPRRPRG